MFYKINKSEFSFITVLIFWIMRMAMPGIKYIFIPSFLILTITFLYQYRNVYLSKNFISEFLRAYSPLIILALFYFIGILISGKIYVNNIKDITEFIIGFLFLFYYFILIHKNQKQESFYRIYRKLLDFFGLASLLVAVIGLVNFYLQLYGDPFFTDTPFGTSINLNKGFYALFSFIGIFSFIPYLNKSLGAKRSFLIQGAILVHIVNILFSFSYESIFVLVTVFVLMVIFQFFAMLGKTRFMKFALNTRIIFLSIILMLAFVSLSQTKLADKHTAFFKYATAYNYNLNKLNDDAFDLTKAKFGLQYYAEQPFVNQVFGSGFGYLEVYGLEFQGDTNKLDYPNNLIVSALLYSGFIGAVFTLLFFIIALYYAIAYLKTYPSFSFIVFTVLVFVFFSISTLFSGPIFLIMFSLAYLIRYQEISDLIVDVNLEKPASKFFKENVDYIVATIMFIVFLPVLIGVSVAILISDGRPVFFSQMRVGKNGKLFRLYKFRSMKNAKSNTTVAAAETNRISSLGRFLRRSKIDELPELFNIIRGDMSFVGPRPDVPGYADILIGEDREILHLRPGLTGPASLKYYNEEDILALQDDPQKYNDEVIFPDKVRINRLYMKNWSFWMDMKLILDTAIKRPFNEADLSRK